jgi:hypothetical protein
MDRICLDCGSSLTGRKDRKFCSDSCRINYHNNKTQEVSPLIRKINILLKKNRSVLERLYNDGIREISMDQLQMNGYQPGWSTYTSTDFAEPKILFCYEFGLIVLGSNQYKIVCSVRIGSNGYNLFGFQKNSNKVEL